MKAGLFIDTSGFYALLVKNDDRHERAKTILAQAAKEKQRFMTSDYVLDETATLLRARGLGHLIAPFFDNIFASQACSIVWMDHELFMKARLFFLKHDDKSWSFTDCTSFVIMKEMKLSSALTKDRHFQEAGFSPLL